MEDTKSVATLIDSTTSKIQQLQKAFAELESHRAVTLNLKWKELEEHFHGLEKSLKRRFHELEDQEKEFETKTVEARELLEKRKATVVAKEHASLEKLQEKRDAAMFSIANTREKYRRVSAEEHLVISDVQDSLANEEKTRDTVTDESSIEDVKDSPESVIDEVTSYPQLLTLCEEMDCGGLQKFVSDNRKNLAAVKEEIPLALRAAPEPAKLVLDSLEGFYSKEVSNADGKKDANLLGLRRTCIMLMECLSVVLTNTELVSVADIITENIKDKAKAIADEWKPRLDALDIDANNGNSLEAHAFLQLLATFSIASDFNDDELSRLIPMVSRRRQAADLCRSLGLSEKMSGVIEVLVNNGRQIDAVNLAFAFDLTSQFSPVPLLKSYYKEARKASPSIKSANYSPTHQDVNERELAALKAVVKCIEEHKLEEGYPLEPLQKRIVRLEKAKAEKKRITEPTKPQSKRPRANGVGSAPLPPLITHIPADKSPYARHIDWYPQHMYERPYIYSAPTDNHCASLLGAPATYNLSPSHGNYFGNGYQYQPSYLH